MKAVIVLAALFAVAFAAHGTSTNYAGDVNYGTVWNPPTLTSTTCTVGSAANPDRFVKFNLTFPANFVIDVQAMFEKGFNSRGIVLIYPGLPDVTVANFNTCSSLVFGRASSSSVPPVREFVYLTNGTYTFIVSGDGTNLTSKRFAIQVTRALWTADTTASPNAWETPYNTNSDCTSTSSGYVARYRTYTYTPATTGSYNFEVQFIANGNEQADFYGVMAIYNGNYPNVTGSNETNPCDGNLYYAGVGSSTDGYVGIYGANLTANVNYTIVVSGWQGDDFGPFGFFVRNPIVGDTSNAPQTYNKPTIPALGVTTNCSQTGSLYKWNIYTFTAYFPLYIVDISANYDSAAVLYQGLGNTTVPPTCENFLIDGDTGDGGPLVAYTTPGQNYTVVITGYSSGSGRYQVLSIGGTGLALPPASTTGDMTTGEESSFAAVLAPVFALFAMLAMFF
jgi:hypothetical protein